MKIRYGFVSNSSSSSFIVAFPDNVDLTNVDDVHACMFPNGPETIRRMSSVDIATIVAHDLKDRQPLTKRKLVTSRELDLDSDDLSKLQEMLPSNSKYYHLVYSDAGWNGTMEHGNIFRSLPQLRISHH